MFFKILITAPSHAARACGAHSNLFPATRCTACVSPQGLLYERVSDDIAVISVRRVSPDTSLGRQDPGED